MDNNKIDTTETMVCEIVGSEDICRRNCELCSIKEIEYVGKQDSRGGCVEGDHDWDMDNDSDWQLPPEFNKEKYMGQGPDLRELQKMNATYVLDGDLYMRNGTIYMRDGEVYNRDGSLYKRLLNTTQDTSKPSTTQLAQQSHEQPEPRENGISLSLLDKAKLIKSLLRRRHMVVFWYMKLMWQHYSVDIGSWMISLVYLVNFFDVHIYVNSALLVCAVIHKLLTDTYITDRFISMTILFSTILLRLIDLQVIFCILLLIIVYDTVVYCRQRRGLTTRSQYYEIEKMFLSEKMRMVHDDFNLDADDSDDDDFGY